MAQATWRWYHNFSKLLAPHEWRHFLSQQVLLAESLIGAEPAKIKARQVALRDTLRGAGFAAIAARAWVFGALYDSQAVEINAGVLAAFVVVLSPCVVTHISGIYPP